MPTRGSLQPWASCTSEMIIPICIYTCIYICRERDIDIISYYVMLPFVILLYDRYDIILNYIVIIVQGLWGFRVSSLSCTRTLQDSSPLDYDYIFFTGYQGPNP